jgi:hypothetical protein
MREIGVNANGVSIWDLGTVAGLMLQQRREEEAEAERTSVASLAAPLFSGRRQADVSVWRIGRLGRGMRRLEGYIQ